MGDSPGVGEREHDDGVARGPLQPQYARRLSYEAYNVAWITALPIEMAAAVAMLDEIHSPLPHVHGDSNSYTLGRIENANPNDRALNIVIASLPSGHYGNNNAAIVAGNLRRTFPSIKITLLVGIGAGIPDKLGDRLRLGDVVVGEKITQYDFGKDLSKGVFKRTSNFTRPPHQVLTVMSNLRAKGEMQDMSRSLSDTVSAMMRRHPDMESYRHPGSNHDLLFHNSYAHRDAIGDCTSCDRLKIVPRPPRENYHPVVHYGTIASGNRLIRDSESRLRLADEIDAVCIDMEAAGLMDQVPCLVIRGICDYADSHKNKKWQRYAAAVAAAYAKLYLPLFAPEGLLLLRDAIKFQDISSRYLDISDAAYGTCQWIRGHTTYQTWLDPAKFPQHRGFLWIYGKPGAGKSTLMKTILSEIDATSIANKDVVISFFFHARGSRLQKSTEGMYRTLLYHLLDRFSVIEDHLQQSLASKSYYKDLQLGLQELRSLLTQTILLIPGASRIIFLIDALDECDEDEIRDMVADFEDRGRRIADSGADIQLYTCFASRHYPQIDLEYGLRLVLEGQRGHSDDLSTYVYRMLRTGDGDAALGVGWQVIEKSRGIFLWIVLVVAILNKEFQRGRLFAVQRRLQEIPERLHDLFESLLRRDDDNIEEFQLCIQWLLFAKRPLKDREYYSAIVAGLYSRGVISLPASMNVPNKDVLERFVSSSSKGLGEITENGTVQFIHQTVPDYLLTRRGAQRLWSELGENFVALSHEQLRRCCLIYMEAVDKELGDTVRAVARARGVGDDDLIMDGAGSRFLFMSYIIEHVINHSKSASAVASQEAFLADFRLRWMHKLQRISDVLGWRPGW